MITGLNHITLAVADVPRSFDFYADVMGFRPRARWAEGAYFEVGGEPDSSGNGLWFCISADAETCAPRGDYTHLAWSVSAEEFPRVCARLRAAGAPQWKENASEGDSLYFRDPDSHKLELHCGDLASRLRAARARPWSDITFFDSDPDAGSGAAL
jgi:catechol 2,3-dioxygenase-like lactoylglutathione lyase family enzyme